jgi:hypothetical protein
MRYPRYAVIPSNRRECLWQCIEAIDPQVDKVIVIDTLGGWSSSSFNDRVFFLAEEGEPNISRWWNRGLDYPATHHRHAMDNDLSTPAKFDVAVLNDDAIVPERWFDAVAGTMRQMGVAAGCSGAMGMPVLHTQNQAPPLATRMQGFAFVLAGELGLRADEQFVWYCGDDDLGRRAAIAGGMVMVPGFPVNHLHPNGQVNDVLAAAIPGDMQRYVDKWGGRPW